jgi:hypothetical protein
LIKRLVKGIDSKPVFFIKVSGFQHYFCKDNN